MFYHFAQINSGAVYKLDDSLGIGHHVIIEANCQDDAYAILTSIIDKDVNLYEFCPCCGNRWINDNMNYDNYNNDCEYNEPYLYDEPIKEVTPNKEIAYVHYGNGSFKKYEV